MNHYRGFRLTTSGGNNYFTFQERKPDPKLRVAPLITGTLTDLAIGDQNAFSEKDHLGKIQSYLGLKNFIAMTHQKIPVYIFDNHNHALYFWYREYFLKHIDKDNILVHIDQHSDMNPNPYPLYDKNLEEVFTFVQEQCNVGNFIQPALQNHFLSKVIQLRTESALINTPLPSTRYILDIDLDFWAPEMSIAQPQESFKKTRNLIRHASLVTIATSPYFLNQNLAIQLLNTLFSSAN